jgi:hypothetical protein
MQTIRKEIKECKQQRYNLQHIVIKLMPEDFQKRMGVNKQTLEIKA